MSGWLERSKAKPATGQAMLPLAHNNRFKQTYYMSFEGYNETSTKLLTTAESLFAEHGYHGVSLRKITARADVNLAAVNYHHSDKQSLYTEILSYRLQQLKRARLTGLAEAETRAAGEPVPLTELVDILARTLLLPSTTIAHGTECRRLLGRILIEPLPFTAPIIASEFQPAMARCGQEIRRHFPGTPPGKFLWQLSLIVGALHHTAAALHDMRTPTSGICRNNDAEAALEIFCEFAVATFTTNRFAT